MNICSSMHRNVASSSIPPATYLYNTLASWTYNSGCTLSSIGGRPGFYVTTGGTKYMYVNTGISSLIGYTISFDMYLVQTGCPEMYFGADSFGSGQMFRWDSRSSQQSGFAEVVSWSIRTGPGNGQLTFPSSTWFTFSISVNPDGICTASVDGVQYPFTWVFRDNGAYIGFHGDNGGGSLYFYNVLVSRTEDPLAYNPTMLLGQPFNTSSFVTTTATNPIIATNVAMSYMLSVANNDYIYSSTNGGTTWTKIFNTSDTYSGCCLSENGVYMYAFCSGSSRFYYSNDYGSMWTLVNVGSGLSSCCCSYSGQDVFLTDLNNGLYYSSDYGVTFTLVVNSVNTGLSNAFYNKGYCYYTGTISGVSYKYTYNTQTTVRTALGTNCSGICLSTNGAYIYVCYYDNATQVSRSIDGGTTWTSTTISYTGNNYFENILCDATGRYVYIMNSSTSLYYSTDYGASFTSIAFANAINSLSMDKSRTVLFLSCATGYYLTKYTSSVSLVTSGLINHYNFMDTNCYSGSGTTAKNLVTSTADLNLVNSPMYQTTTKTVYCKNTNTNLLLNNTYFRTTTNSISFKSISIWYKQLPTLSTAAQYLFDGRGGTSNNSWVLSTSGATGTMIGSNWTSCYYDGGKNQTPSWYGTEFKNGTWHNVTFTSATTMTGYLTFAGNVIDNVEAGNLEFAIILVYNRQITREENAQNYAYFMMNYMSALPTLTSTIAPRMRFDTSLYVGNSSLTYAVSTWANSTYAYTAVQSSGTYMPTYSKYYINGLPAVVYAGGNRLLTASSLPLVGHYISYFFVVMKVSAASGNFLSCDPNGGLWSAGSTHLMFNSSNFQMALNGATDFLTNLVVPLNTPFIIMYYYNTNAGGNQYARLNGTTSSTKNVHGITNALTIQQLDIGGWASGGRTISGGISEILIYTSALTQDNIWAIESYLSTKYNIAIAQGLV